MTLWVALAGLIGVGGTALVTLVVARRTNSGRVDQSPAEELWGAMRSELARVQTRLTDVEARLALAEADLNVSRREVLALQDEASRLRRHVEELEAELAEAERASKRAGR